jgi:CubicO group peptidase (beta-lactamase class C family)
MPLSLPKSLAFRPAWSGTLKDALQRTVDAVREKHKVPGVSVALYAGGEVSLAASGVGNVTSGVEMTTDTIMHIGSITKIFNATLLMQLVDEGSVSLERPVIEYLPDFKLGDAEAARTITVEQLVNHTSGIGGNLLPDAGHDGETIERAVARLGDVPQLHAPGSARSYCNAGTVIAGYLCQRIAGKSWYDLIEERIFEPLGMNHAAVLPEDALLQRASVGHFLDPASGEARRTTHAFLPLGYAPAGTTAMMSAGDLLSFVRAHMANGTGPNGKRVLSAEGAARMRRRSGEVTGPLCFDGSIGWMLLGDGFVHHGGGGPGVLSWVVLHPESQTAVVVLTNADRGFVVFKDVMGPFLEARLGTAPFSAPKPAPETPFDPAAYAGSYENCTTIHTIEARDKRLFLRSQAKAQFYDSSPLERSAAQPLIPLGAGSFMTEIPAGASYASAVSIGFDSPGDDGRMEYLKQSFRLHRRTPGA